MTFLPRVWSGIRCKPGRRMLIVLPSTVIFALFCVPAPIYRRGNRVGEFDRQRPEQ